MRETSRIGKWMAVLLTASLGGATIAAGLRLPGDYVFPQGEGSPGQVTFSHASHVDDKAPTCLACHPTQFAMLQPGAAVGLAPIKHAAMEKGQACGACHGKLAFGFESCELCHK